MNQSLPSDYEACGQCGFDHAYEPNEAHKWHSANETPHTKPNCSRCASQKKQWPASYVYNAANKPDVWFAHYYEHLCQSCLDSLPKLSQEKYEALP